MGEFNDLRLLTVFVTVYRQRGMSAAARVLNVSQPSVTRSIHKLEHELGASLFHRSSAGIVATDFGSRLYQRALSITDQIDSIYADAKHLGVNDRRLLRVATGYGCWVNVCDAVISYRDLHEDVVFNITVASARAHAADSEAGALDVIIANQDTLESASWLKVEPWLSLDFCLAARVDHPVFSKPINRQLESIQKFPFVTHHMLENAHGTLMSGSASLRADDHLLLFRTVAKSNCYSMVNEMAMSEYGNALGLRRVGDHPVGTTDYAVAYPRESVNPDTIAFIEHLKSARD